MKKILIYSFCLLCFACNQQNNTEKGAAQPTPSADSTVAIAKDAYIYGLPLVIMDITRRQMTGDPSSAMYAPANQFRHNSSFPDASFKNVVRPNADTYYSIAWLDLSAEPLVLSLPDTKGRYYMMPMMDAYSNVFASPGTRTTGNKAGNFLVSGPGWSGQVPADMKQVQSPTNTVWIIGRTQVNSKEDGIKNVVPLQQHYTLVLLSQWGKTYTAAPKAAPDASVPKGDPNAIVKAMPIDEFFNYVNSLLQKNPPPAADKTAIERFSEIGIGAGKKFDLTSFPQETKAALNEIPKQLLGRFDDSKNETKGLVNGWNVGRDVIGAYGTDYLNRALVAYFGLGANLREDAIYPSTYFDAAGKQLNGANRYTLHFEKGETPPAKAFWSLTMYDPEGYFVANAINRYTIGDRSNLKTNPDGSIDIYIQKDDPGAGKTANWLPAPAGDFNLLMRVYWPKEAMIDKSWNPPAVVKE